MIALTVDKDLDHMTPFEVAFIVFVAAFALEEYTASKEHGWESESDCDRYWQELTLLQSISQA